MIVLGIDPGVRTGMAVVDTTGQRIQGIWTVNWPKALETLAEIIHFHEPKRVVIELPQPGTWGTGGLAKARAVGQCEQKARELEAAVRRLATAAEVVMRRPVRGGTKRKMTGKTWAAMFNWKGELPSHHARDAAVLAMMGA